MTSLFLSQEYVALALIKAKFENFNESFATNQNLIRLLYLCNENLTNEN